MIAAAPRAYTFDNSRVDLVKRRVLDRHGVPVALSSRAYDVLLYLIEHRFEVVPKDDLLRAAWPGLVVEENNLSQAISSLRRALADPRHEARVIATIPGRGYRFVAEVDVEFAVDASVGAPSMGTLVGGADESEGGSRFGPPIARADDDRAATLSTTAASGLATKGLGRREVLAAVGLSATAVGGWLWSTRDRLVAQRSLAVLPFKPVLASDRNEALELGMADTLIARLSELPGVAVAPLSSVRGYRSSADDPLAAGRALNVAVVLDGHIQLHSERVRLTARLLDVGDGTALWSGRFDEPLSDVFTVQDALAQQIVSALELELTASTRRRLDRRSTSNVEAWQLYLNGRLQWSTRTEASLNRAIELYEAALSLDPNFALAAAGLADAWAVMGVFNIVQPDRAFPRARAAAQRAIGIDPDLAEAQAALGHVMVQYDRDWHGGDRQYLKALELRPTYGQAMFWLANNQVYQGRVSEGVVKAREAQALEPMSVPFAANVGLVQYFARDYAAARDRMTRLLEAAPHYTLGRRILARVMLMQGDVPEALALLHGREDERVPGSL
jgi:DNA-binding winged helix-turn-helix (wHTH) protein/TolB-like protein